MRASIVTIFEKDIQHLAFFVYHRGSDAERRVIATIAEALGRRNVNANITNIAPRIRQMGIEGAVEVANTLLNFSALYRTEEARGVTRGAPVEERHDAGFVWCYPLVFGSQNGSVEPIIPSAPTWGR